MKLKLFNFTNQNNISKNIHYNSPSNSPIKKGIKIPNNNMPIKKELTLDEKIDKITEYILKRLNKIQAVNDQLYMELKGLSKK